ncbi:esterase [Burkholderia sp. SRS-W-2-2016]|uniref:alpha/beta hydrolase n=1 Tax=Burkholderia sp. SRS-W-2-2016 TaxID=1926878 RepID=UPI00094AFC14|nr:alpha/beta hydrolase-fold protein [Burkholderia sp. SRS-W-2-2016]OLL28833.1 esterase [Burkholderia sp. SRS-W-2-2016]
MRRFLRSALVLLAVIAAAPAFASTVTSHNFHSDALGRDWNYTIYLPAGYRADGPRLPVLYLLHGNNGDANDWITQGHLQTAADALIEHKDMPPVVIVMPQGGTDWYVDRKEKMETAFFDDLLPEIETHYAVATQRGGRMIGGVSMGGFGALRYALTQPELFCGALLLSPAIYSNEPPRASAARRVGVFGERQFDPHLWHELNYPAQWDRYMSRPYRLPMFIASGDDDLDIQAEASLLYTHLRLAGNPAALRIIDGGHTWDVWSALLPTALKYTLGCVKPPATEHPSNQRP